VSRSLMTLPATETRKPLRIACFAYAEKKAGSISSANFLMLRAMLDRGHEIDFGPAWKRLSLVAALENEGVWTRDADDLRKRLREREIDTGADDTWAQLVDHALSHLLEPKLIQPTILHDYPVELSPLARRKEGEEGIVERFEYFAGGMELGNAYSELNDAEEQAARFAEMGAEDPDYVEALSYGMPPTAGLGLGIDRLSMLLTGRETIRDVILFPTLRPTE